MTKRIFLSFMVVLAIVLVLPAAVSVQKIVTDNSVEIVAPVLEVTYEDSEVTTNVIKARFENMLNNNFIYDDDFYSHRTIIENSILALLEKSVDGEIEKGLVLGFIADMYGLQVDEKAAEYDFAPASEGKFVVLPRGYTEYQHTIISVTEDEGGYTVVSEVLVLTHDGEQYVTTAITDFVQNEGSSFGYNIVSSSLM